MKPGRTVHFDIDIMPRVLVQELNGATSGIVAQVRGERVGVRVDGRADLFWCNASVLYTDEQMTLIGEEI
jgi:hypothetical protein